MKVDALIFDLDGTLWNSTEAIAKGWNEGAKRAGLDRGEITVSDIESVCGKVFEECMEELFEGLNYDPEEVAPHLLESEREYIQKLGGDLYPGVSSLMEKLRYRYKIYIVSNCQSWYLKAFFDHSEIGGCIEDFETHGATGLSKSENLSFLLKRNNINSAVYIGDTEGDKEAASECGLDFIYAQYGFGNLEGEKNSFSSFRELAEFFLAQGIN